MLVSPSGHHRAQSQQSPSNPEGILRVTVLAGLRVEAAVEVVEHFLLGNQTQTLHGTAIYAYIGLVWGVNVGILVGIYL